MEIKLNDSCMECEECGDREAVFELRPIHAPESVLLCTKCTQALASQHPQHTEAIKRGLLGGLLGGRPATLTRKDRPKIMKMSKGGLTVREIAEKLGCSHNTVYRIMKKEGQ